MFSVLPVIDRVVPSRHLCEFTGLDLEMSITDHYNEVILVLHETFKVCPALLLVMACLFAFCCLVAFAFNVLYNSPNPEMDKRGNDKPATKFTDAS